MTTTYAYDAGGRSASVTAPGSRTTEYAYDTFERVNAVSDAALSYDVLGRVLTATDPRGNVTTTAYDDGPHRHDDRPPRIRNDGGI